MTMIQEVIATDIFRDLDSVNVLNRTMMRDLHYVINKLIYYGDHHIRDFINERYIQTENIDPATISLVWAFEVADDDYLYFFDPDFPDDYRSFLEEKHLIPSKIESLDLRIENLERVLAIAKKLDCTMKMEIDIDQIDNAEILQSIKDAVDTDKVKGISFSMPIHDLNTLRCAIMQNDSTILAILGRYEPVFSKALKRTNGSDVELYNHVHKSWQPSLGEIDISTQVIADYHKNQNILCQ